VDFDVLLTTMLDSIKNFKYRTSTTNTKLKPFLEWHLDETKASQLLTLTWQLCTPD
jgi:hypothetical protein